MSKFNFHLYYVQRKRFLITYIITSKMPKNYWTDELEQLLITWAEKASGYAWLHQKSAI